MDDWVFAYDRFVPDQQGLREALCTLGNGYMATRGAAAEAVADDVHYPGTYLAGGYNRLVSEIAGQCVENEDLVNLPNWLAFTFRINGGEWFDLRQVEILHFRQELRLHEGVLARDVRFRDAAGQITTLAERRFVSMDDMHMAAQEISLTAGNWSGRVELRSALDGTVVNSGVPRYRDLDGRHLEPLATAAAGEEAILLEVATSRSRLWVAEAARIRLRGATAVSRQMRLAPGWIGHDLAVELTRGTTATIEKVVALYTSRDRAAASSRQEAVDAVGRAEDFPSLLDRHRLAWAQLWRRCDIELEDDGSETTLLSLRLHIFHLLQTVSPHSTDLDVGVPARGWHGEAYRGHVFWDELFIFPFLNLRLPLLTRALLRYRYRRLPAARRAAREAGYRGAMFPWQSGSNGREESQRLHLNPRSGRWLADNSHLQRHIGIAVAYNVWQYYEATCDGEFLHDYGAEMLVEVARFWASIADWNEAEQRYEIRGVMGPDEYHDAYPGAERPGLDNNAYTNVMAAWVLWRAREALDLLPEERRRELAETLGLNQAELDHWDRVSRRLKVCFHDDGIISQFEGYDRLAELDWEGCRKRHGDIHRLDRALEAEGDSTNRYKVSKQADVLMLFYLLTAEELTALFGRLGYRFDPAIIPQTIFYYLERTSHGSTLSGIVHSWVMARLDRPRSWQLFCGALDSDIADVQGGTTREGIHLGAMAGTVDLIQRGYTGLEIRGGVLSFHPVLPDPLRCLRFSLRYRQHLLEIAIDRRCMRVTSRKSSSGAVVIACDGQEHRLQPGEVCEFLLEAAQADSGRATA